MRKILGLAALTVAGIALVGLAGPSPSAAQDIITYKDLTANIEEALGVDDTAFVLVVDFDGNGTVFEAVQGKGEDFEFPLSKKEQEIRNVYTATFVAVESSKCIYYIDSTGKRRCRCI